MEQPIETRLGLTTAKASYGANRHSFYAKGPFGRPYNPDQPVLFVVDPDAPRLRSSEALPLNPTDNYALLQQIKSRSRIPDRHLSPPP